MSIGNSTIDPVTSATNPADQQPGNAQASLSGMPDAPELLKIRIQPAQFARALGVSKQSVSRWLKDGWVCLGADGRLDPVIAIGQLLRRCDPGRLRARWLRQAVGEVQELRDNLAHAEDRAEAAAVALRDALATVASRDGWIASADRAMVIFRGLIIDHADELRAAPNGDWSAIMARLEDAANIAADAQLDAQLGAAAAPELDPLDLGLDLNLEQDPATVAEMATIDAALQADPATAAKFAALEAALQAASLDALHGKKGEGGE